jgi:hypothetical protein
LLNEKQNKMKKVDLSDLKVGDKAFSAAIGECRVTYIFEHVIQCDETHEYNVDGTWFDNDDNPTLFHSEQEFREYWGLQRDINAPLTKREQFAMAAMQGILANSNGAMSESGSKKLLSPYGVANLSVQQADALLTKLNEKP